MSHAEFPDSDQNSYEAFGYENLLKTATKFGNLQIISKGYDLELSSVILISEWTWSINIAQFEFRNILIKHYT